MPTPLTYLANVMLLILLRKQPIALGAEITWVLRGREWSQAHDSNKLSSGT